MFAYALWCDTSMHQKNNIVWLQYITQRVWCEGGALDRSRCFSWRFLAFHSHISEIHCLHGSPINIVTTVVQCLDHYEIVVQCLETEPVLSSWRNSRFMENRVYFYGIETHTFLLLEIYARSDTIILLASLTMAFRAKGEGDKVAKLRQIFRQCDIQRKVVRLFQPLSLQETPFSCLRSIKSFQQDGSQFHSLRYIDQKYETHNKVPWIRDVCCDSPTRKSRRAPTAKTTNLKRSDREGCLSRE